MVFLCFDARSTGWVREEFQEEGAAPPTGAALKGHSAARTAPGLFGCVVQLA